VAQGPHAADAHLLTMDTDFLPLRGRAGWSITVLDDKTGLPRPPRASDLWVQASLNQRQRFQQLFFPDGIAFDGNCFIGTGVTAPAFSYLREIRTGNEVACNRNSW
jgi:hypothetical protein